MDKITPEDAMKFVCDFIQKNRLDGETNNQVLARFIKEILFKAQIGAIDYAHIRKYFED